MGFVYLIHADTTDRYKIGFSRKHPKARLKDLQCGNPYALRLVAFVVGEVNDEQAIQSRLLNYYVRGEWFRFDSKELAVASFLNGHQNLRIRKIKKIKTIEQKREELAKKLLVRTLKFAGFTDGETKRYLQTKTEALGTIWYYLADQYLAGTPLPSDRELLELCAAG
jgi:hypothetical protein